MTKMDYSNALQKLVAMQHEISGISPALAHCYPVVVVVYEPLNMNMAC